MSCNTLELKHNSSQATEENNKKTQWIFGFSLKIYSKINLEEPMLLSSRNANSHIVWLSFFLEFVIFTNIQVFFCAFSWTLRSVFSASNRKTSASQQAMTHSGFISDNWYFYNNYYKGTSLHQGTCHCNISPEHVPATFSCVCVCKYMLWSCSCYMSLPNVPATCHLMSTHLDEKTR